MILPDIVELLDCCRRTTIPRQKVCSGNVGQIKLPLFLEQCAPMFIVESAREEFHEQRRQGFHEQRRRLAATLRCGSA
jgi:hypothetical protein